MLPLSTEALEAIALKRPPPSGPLWVQLEISNICNIKCEFCAMHGPWNYQKKGFCDAVPGDKAFCYDGRTASWLNDRLKTKFMEWDAFVLAVDQTLEMGAQDFNLCGLGEPTLNPLFADMIRYISERGGRVSLDTNGTQLIKPGSSDKFLDYGLYGLHVSLNAATEKTYRKVNRSSFSFNDIINELIRLKEVKSAKGLQEPWILPSFIVTRSNYLEIIPFIHLAASVGANHVVIDHMVPGQLSRTELPIGSERQQVLELIKEATLLADELGIGLCTNYHALDSYLQYYIPCVVGYLFTRIQADGTVQGCCSCMHSLGDVTKSQFSEIWYGKLYDDFRREEHSIQITNQPVTNCLCGSCPHVMNNVDYVRMIGDYDALNAAAKKFMLCS